MTNAHIRSESPAPVEYGYRLRHMSAWDRAAIVMLGAAGFAFSYDALRQVALAIHAREALSYLFPLFIDGFIAYGVRALVLLRHRGFGARLYAWCLFLAATGSSLWANALHAITLNRGPQSGSSPLYLGDDVVAVLSALAPLALAGSVHLYIIMARTAESSVPDRPVSRPGPTVNGLEDALPDTEAVRIEHAQSGPRTGRELGTASGPSAADGADASPSGRPQPRADTVRTPASSRAGEESGDLREHEYASGPDGLSAPAGEHGPVRPGGDDSPDDAPAAPVPAEQEPTGPQEADALPDEEKTPVPDGNDSSADREVVDEWMKELLPVAREASIKAGRISRDIVGPVVRDIQPIGNDRLGELLAVLRQEKQDAQPGAAAAGGSSSLW